MNDNDDISDDGKNLWSNLLQEVKEKSSKVRCIPNSLLVLGSELSGKSSLLARLQKSDSKNGVGLEFEFIDVKDESMDENKQLNVWIGSGDTFHSNLLKYALDESNFGFTLCMITVSFSEPWSIIESLEQWLDILKKHIDRLKIDPNIMKNFKDSLSRHFQEYIEPELDTIVPAVVGKRRDADFNYLHPATIDDPDKIILPLGESIFDKNLGIPIIVVITKTDQIATLEQDFQYDDDKFDFIQMNIRQLCLKYGAALCYTSLKDGRNCEMLLRYILHRCYGFPFIDTASVIEKDAIFIPAGWDNINKINILAENLPEDIRNQKYDAFIMKPLSLVRSIAQNRLTEPEMAEDEQVFLMKQQAQIQRIKAMANADPNAKQEPNRGPLSKGSSVAPAAGRSRKNLTGQASVGVNPANPGAQGNEGVLANFFSSLLNKRGTPGGPPLQNQQSTTSDSGKITENSSEAEDSFREDLQAEELPKPIISNVDEKLSPAHRINNIEEGLDELDEEYANETEKEIDEKSEKDLLTIEGEMKNQDYIKEDERKDDDIDNTSKYEEMEPDDDNSTGKQISEWEDNVEGKENNVNEVEMKIENIEVESNIKDSDNFNEDQEIKEEVIVSEINYDNDNVEQEHYSEKSLNEHSMEIINGEEMKNSDTSIDQIVVSDVKSDVQESLDNITESVPSLVHELEATYTVETNFVLKDTESEQKQNNLEDENEEIIKTEENTPEKIFETEKDINDLVEIISTDDHIIGEVKELESTGNGLSADPEEAVETNIEINIHEDMSVDDNELKNIEKLANKLEDSTVGEETEKVLDETNDNGTNVEFSEENICEEQCTKLDNNIEDNEKESFGTESLNDKNKENSENKDESEAKYINIENEENNICEENTEVLPTDKCDLDQTLAFSEEDNSKINTDKKIAEESIEIEGKVGDISIENENVTGDASKNLDHQRELT